MSEDKKWWSSRIDDDGNERWPADESELHERGCPISNAGETVSLRDIHRLVTERSAKPDLKETLITMIALCDYAEDLDALDHFVFHQLHNSCSSVCLACDHGAGWWRWSRKEPLPWPDDNDGHAEDCPYAAARRKLELKRGEYQYRIDAF